jgi:hypothetical protein
MFIDYIQAAMRRAKYDVLPDGEGFFGEIAGFRGLWANAPTLEACRNELLDTLQDWMLIRMENRLRLPVIDGIDLNFGRRRSGRGPSRPKSTKRRVA